MKSKYERYLSYRELCRALANDAAPAERIMLLHVAETWQRLAEEVRGEDLNPARVLH